MNFGFTSVAAITVICYLLAEIIKSAGLDKKWLPGLCGVLGGLLGLVALKIMPTFPAGDFLDAAAIGIVSGLAATGAHQTAVKLSGK